MNNFDNEFELNQFLIILRNCPDFNFIGLVRHFLNKHHLCNPYDLVCGLFSQTNNERTLFLKSKIKTIFIHNICDKDILLEKLLKKNIEPHQEQKDIIIDLFKHYKKVNIQEQIKLLPTIRTIQYVDPLFEVVYSSYYKTKKNQLFFEKAMANWLLNYTEKNIMHNYIVEGAFIVLKKYNFDFDMVLEGQPLFKTFMDKGINNFCMGLHIYQELDLNKQTNYFLIFRNKYLKYLENLEKKNTMGSIQNFLRIASASDIFKKTETSIAKIEALYFKEINTKNYSGENKTKIL